MQLAQFSYVLAKKLVVRQLSMQLMKQVFEDEDTEAMILVDA